MRTTDVGSKRTCPKEPILRECFEELESTRQVVWLGVVEGNTELVFEAQGEGGVVVEISTNARGVNDDRNVVFFEKRRGANSGKHENVRRVNCSATGEDQWKGC